MANRYVHGTPAGSYELTDHELNHFFDLVEGGYLGPGSMLLVYTTGRYHIPHMTPTHVDANVVRGSMKVVGTYNEVVAHGLPSASPTSSCT